LKKTLCIIPALLVSTSLTALPQSAEVTAGQAEFQVQDRSLKITASDKTIINYQQFHIGEGEHVQFVQPSAKSTVLNRVVGKDPSKILGKLTANGRVFLVNSSGIYFGPHASVNTGSFVASTLNIKDEDFLQDKFRFFMEPGSEQASIINHGSIHASPEGFIAFMAPVIENHGSVLAQAGKVIFASAEKVILDFSGDGLIQFSVDGDLKQALIENYGQIEAAGGQVSLSMRTARDAIKMVVNMDGITPANDIEECNGIIRLVSRSKIAAEQVHIEGSRGAKIDVRGELDVSNKNVEGKGGTALILGDSVQLLGAKIDASGHKGGGSVLIGGDYQGEGQIRTARYTLMDNASEIHADALSSGEGGKVILWSDDTTLFNGHISAKGYEKGGFIETSGKMYLTVPGGFVDTSATNGPHGNWLLDPVSITVATGGGASLAQAANCGTNGNITISPATIAAAVSNVTLCAQRNASSSITVTNAVSMNNPGISLSLIAGSTGVGAINLNNNLTTRGGDISFTGVVNLGADVTLNTTNATPAGADISFSNTINGAQALILNGGTGGTITLTGAVGGTTALTSLSATGAIINQSSTVRTTGAISYTGTSSINVNGNVTTSGGAIGMTGPVVVTGSRTFDSTNGGGTAAGANINFSSTLNGAVAVTMRAGTAGIVTLSGAIGGTNPLTNLSFTSANVIQIGNNITVTGANALTFPSPVSLIGTSNVTSNNANISFNSTLNGAQALTLTGGTGITTFTGAVGGTAPLTSLSATAATVTQSATANTTGALSYIGSSSINIGGNITTNGGSIAMTGPVSLTAASVMDTTNGGVTPAGANITFSSTINGAQGLTLTGGTGGTVSFGAVGATAALTSLTASGSTITQNATAKTTGAIGYTGTSALNLGGNVTTNGGIVTLTGPVTLNANTTIDTTNSGTAPTGANISFSSTIDGARNLTLTAGTGGSISLGGAVGGTSALTALNLTSASNVTAAAITASSLTQSAAAGTTTFNGAINTNGVSGISLTGTTYAINNNITTTSGGPFAITHTGTLTYGSGVALTIDGTYTDNGPGSTVFAGAFSLTTNNQNITFNDPITLAGAMSLSTGSGVGNILFASTVNGAQNVNLLSGLGNITFSGGVGQTTPLSAVTVTSANNVSANAFSAASFNQIAGTGTTTFSGSVALSGASGFVFAGNNLTIGSTLSTALTGPANIQVAGTLRLLSGSSLSLDGPFTQSGTGMTQSAGTVTTTNDAIQFGGVLVLTGNTVLNSGAGVGNIVFSNRVEGPGGLTITAGTGNVTFSSAAGGTTRLGALLINSCTDLSAQALTATSIQLASSTGTANLSGNLNTSGASGIQLTGNNITRAGTITTTTGGSYTVTNAGTLNAVTSASSVIDGSYIQNGTGPVNFSGSVTTNNGNISLASAVTLTDALTLSTSTGNGNISFSSTINGTTAGAQALTLTAGNGNIILSGNAGSTTRLGAVTINSAGAVSTQGIQAASLSQISGSGTTTFNGVLNTNAIAGINLNGTSFTFNANATTTAAGPITIQNAGTFTLSSGVALTAGGAFSELGTGTNSLAGQITSGGSLSFARPLSISGNVILSTAAANQDITLSNTVDGGGNLTLAAGTGDIFLNAAMGGSTRLGNFTISSVRNLTTTSITAATITQLAGSGTSTFNGNLNTNAVGGIQKTGTNFVRTGTLVTTNGGPLIVTNSGTLQAVSNSTATIDGQYLQNGTGPVSYNGSITTNNQPISFASDITLVGNMTLNTGAGAGNITLSGTVNGAFNLSLTAGTGNVTLGGGLGGTTPLAAVSIASANHVSTQAISAASITQSAGTGTSTFNGALSTSTVSGISVSGSAFSFLGPVTTTLNGPVSISESTSLNVAASMNLSGAFTQTGAGAVSLGANITTANQPISFASPITLTAGSVLDSGSGSGNITLTTINGAQAFTVSGGTGDVSFSGTVGGTAALSTLTITGDDIALGNIGGIAAGVSGATNITGITSLTFNGSTYNANAQTYAAPAMNLSAGALTTFTSTNDAISFNGSSMQLASGTNVTINTGGGTLSLPPLDAVSGNLRTVILNAGAGSITLSSIGTLAASEFASLSITGGNLFLRGKLVSNAITFSSTGSIFLGNDITVASGSLTFPVAVVRDTSSNSTLTSGGSITFSSTLNGDTDNTRSVTLSAPSGNIIFTGAVGATHPLNNLTISSSVNVTSAAMNIASLTQSAGTGTTTFNGALSTTNVSGISLTGAAFAFNNSITTTNGGPLTIANTGTATFASTATLSIDGNWTQSGSGAVSLANTSTIGSDVSFSGPVTIADDTSISTAAASRNISFLNTLDGPGDLTLAAGGGNISIDGTAGGTTRLGAFVVGSCSNLDMARFSSSSMDITETGGTVSTHGAIDTNGVAGIVLDVENFFRGGGITATNGGPLITSFTGTITGATSDPITVGYLINNGPGLLRFQGAIIADSGEITYHGPLVLIGSSTFDSSQGDGAIHFFSTIDGTQNLTLDAGAGSITLDSALGSTTPLNAFTINSAGNVTTGTISASSITQLSGTGTSHFQGALTTTGTSGISITSAAVTRGAAITTSNGGGLTIANSGVFTSTAAGNINLSGAFTQSGTGNVNLSGSITTNGGGISFASPIALAGAASLDTGTGTANITLSQAVTGANNLTLNARNGNITIGGNVGTALIPIGIFSIVRATDVTTQSVFASSISQLAGLGTSTFGVLSTTAVGGISLTGSAFSFGGAITTTNSGPVSIVHSAAATFSSAATANISSAFTESGGGSVSLSNSMTTAGTIQFLDAVSVIGTASLSSTNNAITLFSTLNGPGNISFTPGTSDLSLQGSAGASSRLGSFTVASARNVSTQAITAASITQSAGTGTTSISGALNTNAIGGVSLTGTAFAITGNITTTNSGPVAIVNSGALTLNGGMAISSSGSFSQSGGGAVSIGANVTTSNANLSFANALTLTAPVTLSTGAGAGNITLSSTVNGAQPLTMIAGTGNITLSGALGGTTRLGAVTFTSATNANVTDITSSSILLTSCTGTFSLIGNFNTNAPAGINVTGNNFFRQGSLTTTNGGPLIVNNSGLISGVAGNTTSVDGGYFQTGTGPINFAGTIATNNAPISLQGPITLVDDGAFSAGNGAITIGGTINGAHDLSFTAGVENIALNSVIGGTTPLGAIVINSSNNFTAAAAIAAESIAGSNIIGDVSLQGVETSGSSGIVLSAHQVTLNADVTTSSGGPVSIELLHIDPLTIADGVSLSLDGAFAQTGSGYVQMGGSIVTSNDNISFASPITLTADVSLNSGAGAGNITFAMGTNGAHGLTLAAGTGSLSLNGSFGVTDPPTSLLISSGTNLTFNRSVNIAGLLSATVSGLTTINAPISTTTSSGVSLTTGTLALNAPITTTNSGPVAIVNTGAATLASSITSSSTFSQSGGGSVSLGADVTTAGSLQFGSAITLSTAVSLNSGGGALILGNTVDGTFDLNVTAAGGSITLSGEIGGTAPIDDFVIVSANNVTAAGITAATITQSAGSGLTHFAGPLSTSAIGGITLTGSQFQFDDTVTTAASGPLSIVHTGLLTIPDAADMTLDGFFAESGGGAISLGGDITTTNDNISWSGPITLTHNVALNTGAGAGNITFGNTVNGPFCLNLSAGTGSVQFSSALGGTTPLNCLSATALTITQAAAITTATTVALTGSANIGANITTTNSNITITGNVTRTTTNNVTLSTGSGAGDISISGTVNGDIVGRNLTLSAGTGNVTLSNRVGGTVPLNNLTVTGNNISISNLGSSGQGSTGTTSLNALSTINFTGTTYNNGAHSYTAGSSFNLTAGALTTFTANNLPISFTTGTIALAPSTPLTLNSNGGAITLSDVTGAGLDLTANANTGTLTYAHIGTVSDPLDTVDLTAGTFVGNPADISAAFINFNSPGVITILSNVSSPGSLLTYNAPVVVAADNITFSTCDGLGGGADIIFNQTLDADDAANSRNIIFQTCGNVLTFNGPVGSIARPTSISIDIASDVNINSAFNAGFLAQVGGTGTTTIADTLDTNGSSGINIETQNIVITGATITTNDGPVVLNNAGTLTAAGAAFNIDGAFQQTGTGPVSIGGSIQTTDDEISFTGAVTLTSAFSLNTVSSSGGNITFQNTIDGGQNLTLTSGTGDILISDDIGGTSRIGIFTVQSARNVTTEAVTAGSIVQTAGTGTSIFNGAINTNTINAVSLTGNAFTINNALTTTTTGLIRVANSGAFTFNSAIASSLGGGLSQTGSGSVSLGGSLTAGGPVSFASNVTLVNATTLNTSAVGANVTFSGTINGGNSLQVNAGASGNVLFSGNIGNTSRIGAFTVVNAANMTAQNITASSITQAAGTGLTSIGSMNTNAIGGVSLTGTNITVNGNLVTTTSGPVAFVNSGTLSLTAGSSTSIAGTFAQSGGGNVSLSGTLLTSNANLSFTNPVTLTGATSLSSGAGAGNITFSSTINGTQNLTLTAGTGNILLSADVGTVSRLSAFTIASAADVTYQQLRALSITQTASSGTTLISGALNTTGSGGISITGTTITQNGTMTSTIGPIAIVNSGTYTKVGTIQSDGMFTQSGGGAVSYTGSLTARDDISFAGNLTLAGASSFSIESGSGDILFSGTVNGAQNLSLSSGTGSISFIGAVGGGTRIGTLTFTSAQNVTAGTITAANISQLGGTGTTTFNGAVNTNAASGISLIGTNFSINSSMTTTNSGPVSIIHSGTLSLSSSANLNISGSFLQTSSAAVSLSGSLAAGDQISFSGPISVSGTASLNSSSNNSDIQFLNTVNGSGSLSLTLGGGDLTFQQSVGSSTALNALTIVSAASVSAQAVTAASVTQSGGSVATTFNGDLTATGAGGIALTGTAFSFLDHVSSAGAITIVNTGAMTTSIGKTITSSGAFSQSGGGTVSLAGSITTSNQNLSFADPITLTAATVLSTGSGVGSITFSSTIDGAQTLSLTAGTGDILALDDIGGTTRLGAITFVSAHDITTQSIICASINQLAGTGTTSVTGAFNTNTPAGMTFVGNNFTRAGALVTTNGGSVHVTNAGLLTGNPINTTSIDGSYIVDGPGGIHFAGTATVNTGQIAFSGPITLVGNGTLNSSAGSGGVAVTGTVDGAYTFTISAGNGDISVTETLGGTEALAALTMTGDQINLANIGGAAAGVTGSTSITSLGTIEFNGTTYNAGAQTYNSPVQFNLNAGALTTFSSGGGALNFQNGILNLGSSTNLAFNTGGGLLSTNSIRASQDSARTFSASSGAGNIQIGTVGLAGNGEFASASLSGATITLNGNLIANTITLSPTVLLNVAGNITSTNTALAFPSPVVLTGSNTFSTGSTGANITFSNTLNGDTDNTRDLTLAAGSGSIVFTGTVGASHPLDFLTISSANNVTAAAISATSLIQSAGSGTSTFNGALTTNGASGIQLTGTHFAINSTVTTTNNGSLTIVNAGTLSLSGTASLAGGFTQTGSGGVSLSGSVSAALPISFAGAVTLSASPSITTSNQNITFSNTLDGSGDLTLTAGSGDVLLSANAGAVARLGAVAVPSAHNITIQDFFAESLDATSTGTMSLVGTLNTNGSAGITLVGVNFVRSGSLVTTNGGNFVVTNSGSITGTGINTTSIDGSYTQNGTGPVFFAGTITTHNHDISFSGPITLLSSGGFDTGSGAGNITFSNTVDGTQSLTFIAGTGNISLAGALGATTPLGAITITSAANVTTQAITAASLTQTAGSGTSTFNGAITTSASSGIQLTGTNIVRGSAWTTTGTGSIIIQNTGTFTSTAVGTIHSVGAFTQSGSGPVSLGRTVETEGGAISFAGAITLANATNLNTFIGSNNISITSTIDGAQNLTLNTNEGNITLSGAVGATTRLSAFTITECNNATLASVRASSFSLIEGKGTATVTSSIDTNGASGVSLTGVDITLNGTVTTTGSGPVTVNNSGLFTLTADCTSAGDFSQVGSGSTALSSAINATGEISFAGALNVTGTASLTTASQPITLSNAMNGSGSMTLDAGTNAISLQANAGATTRLGALTFLQAGDINTLGITAASITQTAGSGATTIIGDLNTNSSSGIHLTGTDFTITGSLISTNGGPCSISHTGVLTLQAGSSTLLSGAFSESGSGGSVLLSGTIHASNQNISFANPITLAEDTTLNSNEGGNITISDAIEGPYDLVLTAGTGDITLSVDIGAATPLTSVTFTSARNISTQAITAGQISQLAGTGTTVCNGALSTTLSAGIDLAGNAFTFLAPVSTTTSGPFSVTNSGTLTISSSAPFSIQGAFSQLGSGSVSLASTIAVSDTLILFSGPITLTDDSVLDLNAEAGSIELAGTVNGAHDFILDGGQGSIVLSGTLGGTTPLSLFQVTECGDFESKAIHASVIDIDSVTGVATFDGSLTTTGALGISLSGFSFELDGNVTTANNGPLSITNSAALSIGPDRTLTIDGAFTQSGEGVVQIGGTIETNGQSISFAAPILLIGDLELESHDGDITFGTDIEGGYSVTVRAGTGDVMVPNAISLSDPLEDFTIVTAHDVTLNGIGSLDTFMQGDLSLTASNIISLFSTTYTAHSQYYSSGADTDFINPGLVTLKTDGGSITFASTEVHLNDGTDLLIETSGGDFVFDSIHGTDFENLTVDTETGEASLGTLPNIGSINSFTVTAGSIVLHGPQDQVNTSFTSDHSILNADDPVDIVSENTAFFNALAGNVGSRSSPILVHTNNQIIAGAVDLADFNGSSVDNTVHSLPSNPPCVVIFNGVTLRDCHAPHPPTPPGPAPTPSPTSSIIGFAAPGFESSYFNLASDYFFFPYFFDERYVKKSIPIFFKPSSALRALNEADQPERLQASHFSR
jgi:hypothetical protein